jgi:hypothetical protein
MSSQSSKRSNGNINNRSDKSQSSKRSRISRPLKSGSRCAAGKLCRRCDYELDEQRYLCVDCNKAVHGPTNGGCGYRIATSQFLWSIYKDVEEDITKKPYGTVCFLCAKRHRYNPKKDGTVRIPVVMHFYRTIHSHLIHRFSSLVASSS